MKHKNRLMVGMSVVLFVLTTVTFILTTPSPALADCPIYEQCAQAWFACCCDQNFWACLYLQDDCIALCGGSGGDCFDPAGQCPPPL